MPLIFVYGTLRSGGPAAGLLRDCRRTGEARVRGALFDVEGRYPALVLDGEGEVHGEVWSCPDAVLSRLDAYEGVEEGLFARAEVEVAGRRCWVYVAGPVLAPRLRSDWRVESGRWEPPGSGGSRGLR